MATLSALLSIHAGRNVNAHRQTLKRVTAVLIQLTFAAQVIIVGVYWPFLHHLVLEKLKTE